MGFRVLHFQTNLGDHRSTLTWSSRDLAPWWCAEDRGSAHQRFVRGPGWTSRAFGPKQTDPPKRTPPKSPPKKTLILHENFGPLLGTLSKNHGQNMLNRAFTYIFGTTWGCLIWTGNGTMELGLGGGDLKLYFESVGETLNTIILQVENQHQDVQLDRF